MFRSALAAAALLAACLTGCYETPRPACAFSCGPEGECPEGYSCRADGWCKRADVPENTECAPPGGDAAPPPDAGPDASQPDAGAPDTGPPDAGPDAGEPDAAV